MFVFTNRVLSLVYILTLISNCKSTSSPDSIRKSVSVNPESKNIALIISNINQFNSTSSSDGEHPDIQRLKNWLEQSIVQTENFAVTVIDRKSKQQVLDQIRQMSSTLDHDSRSRLKTS